VVGCAYYTLGSVAKELGHLIILLEQVSPIYETNDLHLGMFSIQPWTALLTRDLAIINRAEEASSLNNKP